MRGDARNAAIRWDEHSRHRQSDLGPIRTSPGDLDRSSAACIGREPDPERFVVRDREKESAGACDSDRQCSEARRQALDQAGGRQHKTLERQGDGPEPQAEPAFADRPALVTTGD